MNIPKAIGNQKLKMELLFVFWNRYSGLCSWGKSPSLDNCESHMPGKIIFRSNFTSEWHIRSSVSIGSTREKNFFKCPLLGWKKDTWGFPVLPGHQLWSLVVTNGRASLTHIWIAQTSDYRTEDCVETPVTRSHISWNAIADIHTKQREIILEECPRANGHGKAVVLHVFQSPQFWLVGCRNWWSQLRTSLQHLISIHAYHR